MKKTGHNIGKETSMLVLTRIAGERVIIGDEEIVITVLNVKGNQVRLGIDAPRSVGVHREEIYRRIQQEVESGTLKNKEGGSEGAS